MKKALIRISAILLAVVIIGLDLGPAVIALGALSNQLGTNVALGSPLLNDNFEYEDWNKWEMLTFGVFLSNLTVPLVDSYKTAFTVNSKGSKGAGKKALEFGSGNDSAANEALTGMLDYIIQNQSTSSGKPIKAIYKKCDNDAYTITATEEAKDATIRDLLVYTTGMNGLPDNGSLLPTDSFEQHNYIKETYSSAKVIDTLDDGTQKSIYDVYGIKQMRFCDLVVEGTSGQHEIVFSWFNGWDTQMYSAWVSRVLLGDYGKGAMDNLKKMIEENTPIYLDNFGNICARYDGESIVIIPAAGNCHLTTDTKYNMLNSTVLSDKYVNKSGAQLNSKMEAVKDFWCSTTAGGYGAGLPLKSVGASEGSVIVNFDTDADIFNTAKTANGSDLGSNCGSSLNKLMTSQLKDNKSTSFAPRITTIHDWGSGGASVVSAQCIARVAELMSLLYPPSSGAEVLSNIKTEKGDASLFGSYVYVPVTCWSDGTNEKGDNLFVREFTNSYLKYMDGSTSAASTDVQLAAPSTCRTKLQTKTSYVDACKYLWNASDGTDAEYMSPFLKNFILGDGSDNVKSKDKNRSIKSMMTGAVKWNAVQLVTGPFWDTSPDRSDNERIGGVKRVLKIYLRNETMQKAMNVLSVEEGTEFALWTPRIYLTYLYWFGVVGGDNQFNTHLFDESSDLLNTKAEDLFQGAFKTEEEKEAEIRNYTYLMLNPTAGREYRTEIMMNWFTDFLYESYQKSVNFGTSKTVTTGNTGGQSGTGFLHLQSYEENFMTAPIMKNYSQYAIVLIGVLMIAIVIVGVIQRKKAGWYVMSAVLLVNTILVIPSVGEITPYLANKMVQNMFAENMTYWGMAESIENAKLEQESLKLSNATNAGESELTLNDYVRMLNIVYLDRSIMVKSDISKKIMEDQKGIINEIQTLQSTRWLLPTLIRQFSASDGSADYVYQPIADIYDNWSNMYWVYNPDDRLSVQTANSASVSPIDNVNTNNVIRTSLYENYKNTSDSSNTTINTADYMTYTTRSTSRLKDDHELAHPYFYMLDGLNVKQPTDKAKGTDEYWKWYEEGNGVDKDTMISLAETLETQASAYSPTKDGAWRNFGFLWTTEGSGHYFYQVVKDTFKGVDSVAGVINDLQGKYENDARHSFMHYRDTGCVRDILDLEELFTNVIPYMYSVELSACGTDGTDGVLGDTKMTNFSIYSENLKSWMFRSNWVTKLMEDKDLNRPYTIGTANGKFKVEHPMVPDSYYETDSSGAITAGRQMIFSEAQQYEMGLSDADLTPVEIKLVRINKDVAKKWTLLLNYANVPDITTEVLYRQMATDAWLQFNKELSPDRLVNGSKALYPIALDLRSISFDSVMKMLMINSTRDSSYIYGTTIKTVIANSDIFVALLLWAAAWFSSILTPLLRSGVLGSIFYLTIFSLACNLLAGGITKLKITAAYLINNIGYLVLVGLYYLVFALMIGSSTADSVLSLGSTTIDAGPPVWQIIIILVVNIIFDVASGFILLFLVNNAKDMGFEVFATWGNMMANRVGGAIKKLKKAKKNLGGSSDSIGGSKKSGGKSGRKGSGKNKGSGDSGVDSSGGDGETKVNSKETKVYTDKSSKGTEKSSNESAEAETDSSASGYTLDKVDDSSSNSKENYFDSETAKGKDMGE